MICVECSNPVPTLYTYYSSDNIRATTCGKCHKFADKYIEYDSVLIGLDLILLRPQAIRHMVFNVLSPSDDFAVLAQTWRLHLVLLLFDVYIHWACAEKSGDRQMQQFLATTSTITQYASFLAVCIVETGTVHAVTFLLMRAIAGWSLPNALSVALLLSSGSKLLPLLTLIWRYETPKVLTFVWCVLGIVMVEVLAAALKIGYWRALIITSIALGCRWYVTDYLLWPYLSTQK